MKTNNPSQEIILNDYSKLLVEIKKSIEEAGKNIELVATRQKIVMAFQIGKLIDENLAENRSEEYGNKLFEQLAQNISINKSVLYKMHSFYRAYPVLPPDDEKLNWSHYRALAEIKDSDKRQYLEHLAIENSWSSRDLEAEVKNSKPPKNENQSTKKTIESSFKKIIKNQKLKSILWPIRGQLFTYQLANLVNSNQTFIDLGFKVFRETNSKIPVGEIVTSVKKANVTKNDQYSCKKSDLPNKKLNIYQAYLEKVVDGDTINVVIDLGFDTFHREIIRLKGINSPEKGTSLGKKSAKFLTNILKDAPFLIIKTIKTDIYGRYVADVFFDSKNQSDPQKVSDQGVYLNQLLLDEKMAVILD
jgi:endonuclease YncB( thermonuclease family)